MKNLNFSDIFPKWAKIALFILSSIAIVLLVGAFALQKWADSQVESANLAQNAGIAIGLNYVNHTKI